MPRGIVLIRFEGKWEHVEQALIELQRSPSFVAQSECIIESWCPCMGTADYAARVFGVSLEALRQASVQIRQVIFAKGGTVHGATLTTTIVGSTLLEQESPLRYAKEMLRSQAAALPAQGKQLSVPDRDKAKVAAMLAAYLSETLPSIQYILGKLSNNGIDFGGVYAPLYNGLSELLKDRALIHGGDVGELIDRHFEKCSETIGIK